MAVPIMWFGPANAADLIGVRFGPNGEKTRLVIDLAGDPEFEISGDRKGKGRIVLGFDNLTANKAARAEFAKSSAGKGHFANYQFTLGPDGKASAIFAFRKTARVKEAFLLEPKGDVKFHRLVVDVETASKAAFINSLPKQYAGLEDVIRRATSPILTRTKKDPQDSKPDDAAPSPSLAPTTPQKSKKVASTANRKKIIVIDPGHGGADPGATGSGGSLEKTATLAAALQLRKILEKSNDYEIVLTRDDDTRLRPAEREKIARDAHADLFVSLHADAIGNASVSGASVYTLSEEGSERSAKTAREEGDYVVYDLDLDAFDSDVSDVLFQLAQGRTQNESAAFAKLLINNLTGKVPMLNRSHRQGDLRVLLAPDVPAVLLEMAFISNAIDEENLKSEAWRRKVAAGVASAIDQYFKDRESLTLTENGVAGAR